MRNMPRPPATLFWTALLLPGCAATPPAAASALPACLTVNTPIDVVAANARGKEVLQHDVPGLLTNPKYPMFSGMSLSQLQALSNGKLSAARVAKVQADLAMIKPGG